MQLSAFVYPGKVRSRSVPRGIVNIPGSAVGKKTEGGAVGCFLAAPFLYSRTKNVLLPCIVFIRLSSYVDAIGISRVTKYAVCCLAVRPLVNQSDNSKPVCILLPR